MKKDTFEVDCKIGGGPSTYTHGRGYFAANITTYSNTGSTPLHGDAAACSVRSYERDHHPHLCHGIAQTYSRSGAR